MRFLKGDQHPRWRRGRARKPYTMTEDALRARRHNFSNVRRLRATGETTTIKLFIWQSFFDSAPRPSERTLARQLHVWPSYVHKLMRKATTEGMDALIEHGKPVTLDDLAHAQRFTVRVQEQEPGLLAAVPLSRSPEEPPARTPDETIVETWREVREWKRKNPRERGRVLFSVPVR